MSEILTIESRRKTRENTGSPGRPYLVEKEYYTSGQVAKLLKMPDRTVRRYLTTKRLEGKQHPITGTWQISRGSLVQFIEKHGLAVKIPADEGGDVNPEV